MRNTRKRYHEDTQDEDFGRGDADCDRHRPTLFAQGTKDIPSDAIVGKIVSIDQNGGTWQLLVRDANGIESIFRPAEDCKLVLPLESFRNDDYVAIVSNGIMAQSLPPQGTALEIRWINPLVAQGLVQVTSLAIDGNPEVLEDKFSYSMVHADECNHDAGDFLTQDTLRKARSTPLRRRT
jgi:hypothetical protein